jgi:hypothetical protein
VTGPEAGFAVLTFLRANGWDGASTTTGGRGVASSAVTSLPEVMAAASCALLGADTAKLIAALASATYANLDTEITPQTQYLPGLLYTAVYNAGNLK